MPRPTRRSHAASIYFHSAPGTTLYLFSLLVTSLVVHASGPGLISRLLRQESTNLSNMGQHPVRLLLASAFLIDTGGVIPWLVGFGIVLAPAERWLGTRRWLVIFIAGHVGATLITLVGIWHITHGGRTDLALVHSIDVGVSYGLYAVAAALSYRLPSKWRLVFALGLLTSLVVVALATHGFTDTGHVRAVVIGLAAYPVVRPRMVPEDRLVSDDRALLHLTGGRPRLTSVLWQDHVVAIWAVALLASGPLAGVVVAFLSNDIRGVPSLAVVGITVASAGFIGWGQRGVARPVS